MADPWFGLPVLNHDIPVIAFTRRHGRAPVQAASTGDGKTKRTNGGRVEISLLKNNLISWLPLGRTAAPVGKTSRDIVSRLFSSLAKGGFCWCPSLSRWLRRLGWLASRAVVDTLENMAERRCCLYQDGPRIIEICSLWDPNGNALLLPSRLSGRPAGSRCCFRQGL
jgi:hypothetical protein